MITACVMVKIGQNVPEHQTTLSTLIGSAGKVDKLCVPQSAPVTEQTI
jgi:hypothetical protein